MYVPIITPDRLVDDSQQTTVGGSQVFEILASQNARMLMGFLRSLVRSPDLIEDLFQEVMMTAWQKIDRFDRTKQFGPWLRGIAVNKVRQLRDQQRRDLLICDDDVMMALEARYAVSAADEDISVLVNQLFHCVDKLPDKLRAAIKFVNERGLAMRDASSKLGVSEEAVKKRIQRGRKLLAACMNQVGGGNERT